MRKIVPDVIEKRCHIALDFVAKLSSTADSSDNDKTHVLPDENFITVGVERFRFAEVLLQANVSTRIQRNPQHVFPEPDASPQHLVACACSLNHP